MKLTKRMQTVVRLMAEGWELGWSLSSWHRHAWLQRNGLGKGGDSENIHAGTFLALLDRDLIACKEERFPTALYVLTAAGKAAAKQLTDGER